jgi:hypothetical protein
MMAPGSVAARFTIFVGSEGPAAAHSLSHRKASPRLLLLVLVLSTVVICATRIPTRSRFLFSWDSVNFALALDHIDMRLHQPHPPGYLGFVFAARALRPFAGDANAAFLDWNLIAAIAVAVLVFALAYEMAPRAPTRHGWIAWSVLLPSTQFWFHTNVADIYVSEMLVTLAIAYACLRVFRGEQGSFFWVACALALAAWFKLTAMALMIPLVVYCSWKSPARVPARAVGLFLVLVAGFGLVVWQVQGVAGYLDQLWSISRGTAISGRGIIAASWARSLNSNVRDVAYACSTGIGLMNIPLLVLSVAAGTSRMIPGRRTMAFALTWALPSLAVLILVHFGNRGYTLSLLPVACLAIAFVYGQQRRTGILVALLVVQALCSAAHFGFARPFSDEASGRGRKYADKTWTQKFCTEASSLTHETYFAIRRTDADMAWLRQMTARACPPGQRAAIVADSDTINWRKTMYYLPEMRSVDVPRRAGDAFLLAEGRRQLPPAASPLVLVDTCRIYWVLPERDRLLEQLNASGQLRSIRNGDARLFWMDAPVTITYTAGSIAVRP